MIRSLILIIVLNVLFLILALWVAILPPEPLIKRVQSAFESGDLIQQDYLAFDSQRGFHQYNDCLILQMITNRDGGTLTTAVGPLLYIKDETYTDYCNTLFRILDEDTDRSEYLVSRYTRYWHGYNPISATLLLAFDLSSVRQGLKIALYGTLILLIIATGTRHWGLFAVAAGITATGAFFWAVPYFGQSLCHAPGDIFVILGIACLFFWRERLSCLTTFIPFCAAYGAGVVYLEFLTGLLPTAAGLLFPIAYLIAMSRPGHENRPLQGWTFAIVGLMAFAFGGGLTVVIKQILSVILFGSQVLDSFVGNLEFYTSPATSVDNGLSALKRAAKILAYGSKSGAILLYAAAVLAWLAAGYLALRKTGRAGARSLSDFLAFAAGAMVIVVWITLFQTHTVGHINFMVRILIVPISLGWGALAWQLITAPGRDSAAPRWAISKEMRQG